MSAVAAWIGIGGSSRRGDRLSKVDCRRIYLKLATMLHFMKVEDAIADLLREEERRRRPNKAVITVLRRWGTVMAGGKSFSEAVAGTVPDDDLVLIYAFEKGDDKTQTNLPAGLQHIVKARDGIGRIKNLIAARMFQPAMMFAGVVGLLVFYTFMIFPAYEDVYPMRRWTGMAGIMAGMAEFVVGWGPYVFSLVALGIYLVIRGLPKDGRFRELRVKLDRIPPWSIYRYVNGASFMLALAALTSVESVDKAIGMLRTAAKTQWLRNRIHQIHVHMGRGNLGEAMELAGHGFPDPEIIHDLKTYAKHANINLVLGRMAEEELANAEARAGRAVKVVSGILYAIAGILMLVVASGLFDLTGQVQRL